MNQIIISIINSRKPKVNGLNGIGNCSKEKWSRDHYDRDDVIDADVLSQKRIPNSYTTTMETTSFRGPSQLAETPGTSSNMRAALRGVEYIAQHIKNQDKDNEVSVKFFQIYSLRKSKLTLKIAFEYKFLSCWTSSS